MENKKKHQTKEARTKKGEIDIRPDVGLCCGLIKKGINDIAKQSQQ